MSAGLFGSLFNGVLGWASSLIANESAKEDRNQSREIHDDEMTFNREEAQKNRDFQTAERLASQEFDLDMWNQNNFYNSRAEQLKRDKEAGVNPNAAYRGPSVASNPVTTTPMSGSQASYSSNLASAMLGRSPNMLSSISSMIGSLAGARKAETEAQLNEYNLEWNKKTESQRIEELKVNIKYQKAQIDGILAKAGLDKASTREIEERTRFIADLSDAELRIRMQTLTNLYNENVALIKTTEQNLKESQSRIELNEKQGTNIDADTGKTESENLLLKLEAKFADEMGMPVGSSDEQFFWKLWKQGLLPEFIDNVRVPLERSTWKPDDWSVRNFIPGSYFRARSFDHRTGYMNPRTYWPNLGHAFKRTGPNHY